MPPWAIVVAVEAELEVGALRRIRRIAQAHVL
jgi:hypothetical protein